MTIDLDVAFNSTDDKQFILFNVGAASEQFIYLSFSSGTLITSQFPTLLQAIQAQ